MRSVLIWIWCAAFGHVLVARAGRPQYGVGFDLSLDYAVATIYFANNTFVDVATVQGGEAYRQAMRMFMSSIVEETTVLPVQHSSLSLIQQQLPDWLQPTIGKLCSHLPRSWLSTYNLDNTARAFAPMLHTLKTATESYLGMVDSLHAIGISLPQSMSPQMHHSLQTAASSQSLNILELRLSRLPAGAHAAIGYGVNAKCFNFPRDYCEEERLTLTIDYSRAALTALLLHEDTPLYHTLRSIHSEALGQTALDRTCSSPDHLDSDCTAALRAALTNITQLPVSEDKDAKELTFIQTIVLHGESASDSRLNSVLRDVLRRDDDDDVETTINGGQSASIVSPLYAAAHGIAKGSWLVLDEPLPNGCNCNDFTRRRMC